MAFKDYFEYFEPVILKDDYEFKSDEIGNSISSFEEIKSKESFEGYSIALIGLTEIRNSKHKFGDEKACDIVRSNFYRLKKHQTKVPIADLGNLKNGLTVHDTYAAISNICAELIRMQVLPILVGGSHDLTLGQYGAYKQLAQIVNITNVDSRFDIGNPDDEISSDSFIGKIILEQPNYLFNYSHIGHQLYFVGVDAVEKMKRLYFDTFRLGQVRTDITECEPILRNSDLLTFDIASIKQSDAPGSTNPSPNGFYSEEACQLLFYAGISEKISSVGLYEADNTKDDNNQTMALIAQMIWYFVEGFTKRKNEMPAFNRNGYLKYTVALGKSEHEIIFIKSPKSERWWMEIPIIDNYTKFKRHHIVPCSYKDYQQALNNEMPERWWQTFKKLC